MVKKIVNPGSAIGEAIGAAMEVALAAHIGRLADEFGYHYITAGVRLTKGGQRAKKLLLFDNFGNEYNIDGVIANAAMQPLVIIESKYIRYTKHNRDKGSWISTAHAAVRRRYASIRSSIAVLAGSWSRSSLAMLKSHDINLFVVPFSVISAAFARRGINILWAEKERQMVIEAWEQFVALDANAIAAIGEEMIAPITPDLEALLRAVLDDATPREVDRVVVELVSNLGEVRMVEFASLEEAMSFLGELEPGTVFLVDAALSLFDAPP